MKTYVLTPNKYCLDSSKDWSQDMFLLSNMANYPQIIPVTPSYLEHCTAGRK